MIVRRRGMRYNRIETIATGRMKGCEHQEGEGRMIYIAICDDDGECRKNLERFCEKFFAGREETTLVSFASGEDFLKDVERRIESFDLVLLDIEMNGISGLQVKRYLEKTQDIQILFVTGYDSYMPQAFGYRVFGFLKKPVQYGEFEGKMRELLQILEPKRRFVVAVSSTGKRKIFLRDINWIEAKGKYVIFSLKRGEKAERLLTEYRSYGYWKEKLQDCDFREIRKGCLANFENVTAVEAGTVIFQSGESMRCSVRKRTEIIRYFESYIDEHAR